MPCDYSKYPKEWKNEIRPRILARAKNCCEFCKVPNYEYVFRGMYNDQEVFQTSEGDVYSYPSGDLLFTDIQADISPINGKDKAIKIVLTIAHLDHDETNPDVKDDRLAALCQKCHLGYDAKEKKRRKSQKQNLLF
jgi:hypothetical protein